MTAPASVLVTGGHGFIGSHLCARLVQRGHRVRILARPGADLSNLDGLDVEVAQGDLTDPGSLPAALAGVTRVFHLAGALKGFSEEALLAVNRDGTRNLVGACPPDLERFVLVSSLAAAGPSPGGPEPRPPGAPDAPLTWYGRSKVEAERVVLASGLPCVILRPPVVFGPRDRDVLSYFRIAARGFLPVPGTRERWYSLVFAPDLADGILRAGEAPLPSGETLPLVNAEPVTWLDLGRHIARALGRRGRELHLPEAAIRAAGQVAGLAARLRGRPEIFSPQKVIEMLAPAWVASPEKARTLLGWSAGTPLDQALWQTVRWYRDHGWL
ncbi:NAD-dependent epimerase/dehydratase family protein [Mesoterricola silvestris]|uniref:NAD-dependent epimerase n=1 Tax=Mesoterricola silvestris TaxID=2927979 RepID=A0AA48H7Q1_9BACT|nr:NAD-dependent epimerase/dehydratase family protein [Mesoterricola silvestris]BDU73308.1 NAD-dependent epimerase [Mesoterricola silvestris]